MANMLDYLAWRGDLPVDRDPLNENDRLIFSQLAYVAFDRLVPSGYGDSVALGEAASRLLAMDPEAETIHQTSYLWEGNKRLLTALSVSARFAPMRLSGYVSEISQEHQKQFAALTIQPGDGSVQVAFRGTDDTLVGWKEDLNMVFDAPVPAQREAVSYLCGAAALPARCMSAGIPRAATWRSMRRRIAPRACRRASSRLSTLTARAWTSRPWRPRATPASARA